MAMARFYVEHGVADADLFRLYDFFGALKKRLVLLATTGICAALMGVTALLMTPVYRSQVVIAPVPESTDSISLDNAKQLSGGILSTIMGNGSDNGTRLDEEMTVLQSRDFTEKFIKDKDLLPTLFPKLWDQRNKRWKEGISRVPTLERGYEAFDKLRKISLDTNEDFVVLQIDWTDRFMAAEWANEMAGRLNDELRKKAIQTAQVMFRYLQAELLTASDVEERTAISRVIESQVKKEMLARVSSDFEVKIVAGAVVADADDPQRPNKILMIGIGAFFGLLVGIASSLLLYRRQLSTHGALF